MKNQASFVVFIGFNLSLIVSCNNNSLQESKKGHDLELNSACIDSLDTDTSCNYIYTNVPANLHSETDSVFNIIQSMDDSAHLITAIREKLIELQFHSILNDSNFSYVRKRFNRRTYVTIEDTLASNKKIIINSYFWEGGEKYHNIMMYLTDPE